VVNKLYLSTWWNNIDVVNFRYHQTIKAVVRSTQVSIPTLLTHLIQLSDVRTISAKHAAFDRQMKKPSKVPRELAEYRSVVSKFAFELILKEHTKAIGRQNDTNDELDDFVSPCQCSFASSYQLPCRHFFSHCIQNNIDLYDNSLIHARWAPTAPADGTVTSSTAVNVVSLNPNIQTQQQRFKVAMSRCTVIASVLAELPSREFPAALKWLDEVEVHAKQRNWSVPSAAEDGLCSFVKIVLHF